MMAENNIERFIAKANAEHTTSTTPTTQMLSETTGMELDLDQDQWRELAPGVDPSAYIPKPLSSNITQTMQPMISSVDTGRTPPLSFQTPSKSDIEDYFASPGVCGLLNLGNTCYMNAGLQCIFSVERIAKFYLNDNVPKPVINNITKEDEEHKSKRQKQEQTNNSTDNDNEEQEDMTTEEMADKDSKPKEEDTSKTTNNTTKSNNNNDTIDTTRLCQGQISTSFSYLMHKLWTGHFSAIVPNNFKTVLGYMYSQFSSFRQQDCQEFLVVLLDRLHEEICIDRGTPTTNNNNSSSGSTDNNVSVIADTFQGDLESQVTCSRCGHISTKTDPFMYLSVPIPHAHERQIEIIWSPITRPPAIRNVIKCLVVIPKISTVLHIKKALCELLEGVVTPDHVTLAHVKNRCIELTLSDSLAATHVKDKDFVIYGFETDQQAIISAPPSSVNQTDSTIQPTTMNGYTQLTNIESVTTDCSIEDNHRDPWTVQPDSDSMETTPLVNEEDEFVPLINSESDETSHHATPTDTPLLISDKKVVVMEWHSCSICLEEMVDSDLLIHSTCGGLLCSDCLESSVQHSIKDDGKMPCPVCQKFIIHTKDFVPLANAEDTSNNIVRLLQITVMIRHEDSVGNWAVIGHPALVNLPQNESIDYYYSTISALIPAHLSNEAWSLALTDGKVN